MSELINKKIFIAGHRGLVGSALLRRLQKLGCSHLITASSRDLDLRDQRATADFFQDQTPEVVFFAAARVGGIVANNTRRAEFLYDNLIIAANVIDAAYRSNVEWLLNFGSSCIYPKLAAQPITEDALLTGPLEATNEPYAIAKIAALKLVENYNRQYGTSYFSAMPTNLYGPFDNFDETGSHVIPAMIRKFHEAKISGADHVLLWGDGSPRREFLFSEDLAAAAVHLYDHRIELQGQSTSFINVGYGDDLSIAELADQIRAVVGFKGKIVWDATKPNGTPRKLMDSTAMRNLGWNPKVPLVDGLGEVYEWFQGMLGSRGELRL